MQDAGRKAGISHEVLQALTILGDFGRVESWKEGAGRWLQRWEDQVPGCLPCQAPQGVQAECPPCPEASA